jgi:hypothetical protein
VTDRTFYADFHLHTLAAREEDAMTRKNFFRRPTHREQLKFEQILLEQMQVQHWAVVVFISALQSDVLLTLN